MIPQPQQIKITKLSQENRFPIRNLNNNDIGRLISVSGKILKTFI